MNTLQSLDRNNRKLEDNIYDEIERLQAKLNEIKFNTAESVEVTYPNNWLFEQREFNRISFYIKGIKVELAVQPATIQFGSVELNIENEEKDIQELIDYLAEKLEECRQDVKLLQVKYTR